tara:strand:+ start:427 stop:750 length:324 start_codon:yes stop_codon:yes gene_type:complete
MKRIILIMTLALGAMSCEKEEIEPKSRFVYATNNSIKFRVASNTGCESITINGVTTNIGSLNRGEFVSLTRDSLPKGVRIISSRSSWYYAKGHDTFEATGDITVINN